MRIRITLWTTAFAVLLLSAQSVIGRQGNRGTSAKNEGQKMESKVKGKPLACNPFALNASERERHKRLREQLSKDVKGMSELRDGYELHLSDESSAITTVAEWISLERRCCPFFTFKLEIEGPGKPVLLRLTGPEGVKQFLQSELGFK